MDLEELQLQLELELSSDIDFEKGESDFDDEDSGQRFIPAAPVSETIEKEASLSEEDESWLRFLRSVEDRRPSLTSLKDLESGVHSKTSLEKVEDFRDSPISEDLQAQPPRFYHSPAVELEVREAMEGILTTLDFVHQLSLPSLDDEILPCLLPLCGPIDLLSCPTPYALYVGVGIKSFTEEDEEMISNAIASPQFDITTISSHENEAFHKPTASSFNNFNENDSSFSLILPVPAPIIILDNEATLETDRARRAERKTRRTQLAEREHQRLRLQKATVSLQKTLRGFVSRKKGLRLNSAFEWIIAALVASVVAEELLSVTTSSLQSIRNDSEMAERAREREVKDREGVHMDVEERTSRIISRERIEGDCMEGEHFLASSLRQLQHKLPKVPTTVPPSLPIPVELTLSWKALIHQECQSFNSYTFSRSGRDLAASLFLSSPVSSHQVLSTVKPSGLAQAHRAWVDRLPLLQSDKIAESFSTVILSRGDKLKPQVLDEKLTELVLRYSQGASPAVIRALDLSVEGLRSAAFLSPFVSLRSLNLNVNCLLDLHDLKSLSLLEELTVKDNALIDVSSLQYLVNLRRLQLDVNKISDFCSLQNVSKLVSISASSNQISSFPTLPATVERVELYHNNIAIITTKSFVHLRTLMHLDLGRNHLTVLENGVLDSCCLLTTLILSQNKLEELPVLKLPFLRVLWLSGNRVSSFARWTASSDSSLVIFLPMLEKLYLQDNRITCIEPSSLFQSPFLSELDISFNAIVSVENLSGIRAPNLKFLSIQDNPVSAFENISAFLQIQCPRLCCLNGSHISLSRISLSTNSLPEANIYVSRDASLKHVVSFLMHEQNFQKFIDRSRTKKEEISEGIGADVALLRSHLILFQDERKLFEDRTLCFVPNSNPLLALKNSEKNGDGSVKAATTIEKVFRGHLTRQRLRKALRSVEYQDEDIEAMLRDDALEFEMPSELLAGWMDYTSSTTSFSASVSSCAEADGMAARLPSSRGSPMVYGDHIKRRNPERSMSGPSPLESASSAQYCVGIGDPSRPSSSTTECTLLSVSTEARSELLGVAPPKNSSSAINGWGITDPSLLATLDKRNRRMKRFVAAHETRERQKDPEFRLQQFVKNASGSTRNSNNPKRASERRAVHMPAWAVGYPVQDEEKEEG